jgi:hypothetical protein
MAAAPPPESTSVHYVEIPIDDRPLVAQRH